MKRTHFLPVFMLFALISTLPPAGRAAADVGAVYLTPHFHYDPVFEKDQRDYTFIGFDRCRRFLQCLKDDPAYRVVFSEIDYLKPFFDTFPEERQTLLGLIAANRIETGGSYNEPNEMSIGGEGIIRNILYGRAYHEGVLGDKRDLVYMPFDVFGHTPQLAQILLKSRYIGAVWRKGNPEAEKYVGVTVPGLPPDFMSLSPDGSLLHMRREHYKAVSGTTSEEDLVNKVTKKKALQDKLGLAADFGLLSSDDFAYPESWLTGHSAALARLNPPIYISGPTAYFEEIAKQLAASGTMLMPVISRDFSLYHTGTALSRVDFKIGNRLAENALLSAEKFSTVASLLGAPYPEIEIDKAWRQLLFNQHHDGITGTCCDRCYFDLLSGYREALELAAGAYGDAAERIADIVDAGKAGKDAKGKPLGRPLVVFNSSGWKRTDVVHARVANIARFLVSAGPMLPIVIDSSGKKLPTEFEGAVSITQDSRKNKMRSSSPQDNYYFSFVATDVPPMGYKTYYVDFEIHANQMTDETTIENEFYSVTVDPARGGTITKLVDMQAGRTIIDPSTKFPGNELIVLKEDNAPRYVAWELSTAGVKDSSSKHAAKVSVKKGHASAALIVEGDLPGLGGYRQEIRLYNGVKRIDFIATLKSPAGSTVAADRNLWVVRFPGELHGTGPVVEDRFYAAARRESLQPLNYRTDLDKMLSLSAPYSALNWVEEGAAVRVNVIDKKKNVVDGLAVGLCGIVHTKSAVSTGAARALQSALVFRGVTCTPSLDTEDNSADLLNRNFRIVLDNGGDNSFAKTLLDKSPDKNKFADRLRHDGYAMLLISGDPASPAAAISNTLIIAAANDDGLRKITGALNELIRQKSEIIIRRDEDARGVQNPRPPDDYGIALINRGNILHSFDSNGTVVMALFHNAPWSAAVDGVPFSFPDEKNHRYEYSLYPHAGDWRAAKTYRVGHDVNEPMIAQIPDFSNVENGRFTLGATASTEVKAKPLPDEMSFFDIETKSGVLSAIKPAGNPYAHMRTSAEAGPKNGVIMRFYEAEGQPDYVRVKFFRPVSAVWHVNLMEEIIPGTKQIPVSKDNSIKFEIGANAVETILVQFKNVEHDTGKEHPSAINDYLIITPHNPAKKRTESGTLFSRYWRLNLGAAYEMNSPVSVTLDFPIDKKLPPPELKGMGSGKSEKKSIKKGKNRLRLTVSNNSTDTPLKGDLKIDAPGDWKATPESLKVEFAPLGGWATDVEIDADTPVDSGYIRASLVAPGTIETNVSPVNPTWFDAIPVGKHPELDASAEIIRGKDGDARPCASLQVHISNNQGGLLDGAVEPVGPVETWPAELVGALSLVEITPRKQYFSIDANENATLEFPVCDSAPDVGKKNYWLMVKISYNGDLKYIPVKFKE